MAVKSFRHKGLADFWSKGTTKGIRADLAGRVARCLALLNAATAVTDLRQVPSLRLHALHGDPQRWSISVNGPWRIIFQWQDGNAFAVDLEQYH